MATAHHMAAQAANSSFIRRMFETGLKLKAIHGADNVYDFSLGNPVLPPPAAFTWELARLAAEPWAGKHAYMPNAGYPVVREKLSAWLEKSQGVAPGADRILMTCGAGGGLNVVFKTLLNPGDEVLASLPCFMEYGFYAANHGGRLVTVPCKADFDLDIGAFEAAITAKTALVVVNSPNNPSGRIYPESSLKALADLLDHKSRQLGRRIYLVSDEPYRSMSWGKPVPGILSAYPHSLVVSSWSKELSIPGERIGFVAINPAAEDAQGLFDIAVLCNRILGYVNAPALMQMAVANCLGQTADLEAYRRKRDLLCPALRACGYDIPDPDGTFYAFVKAPGGDDLAFVDRLQEERILAVPGRGFGLPGYFRLAFCTGDDTISRSLPGFARAIAK